MSYPYHDDPMFTLTGIFRLIAIVEVIVLGVLLVWK